MNFSPELWEQLFDFDLWAYVSSFFILVCCNGVRVSGYLTSKMSFCLLGCSHIPLESLLDNCIPRKCICLQCALTEDCSRATWRSPYRLLFARERKVTSSQFRLSLAICLYISCWKLFSCQTEFAVGCTFYCLQFSVYVHLKALLRFRVRRLEAIRNVASYSFTPKMLSKRPFV